MVRGALRAILLPLLAAGAFGCAGPDEGGAQLDSSDVVLTTNGLTTVNGLSTHNGLTSNGLSTINGLSTHNGLSSTVGLMTTASGRTTIEYLVRCALPLGDSITKQDQNGVSYTFAGQIGLAPGWKDGACDTSCQQSVSACLLAHVNTSGVHIPLWLVSPAPAIGWGTNPQYPNREGTFFGNIFTPNAGSGAVDAFYCDGPGFSKDTVPGRLGATQVDAPYTDPYMLDVGAGDCTPCASSRRDGPNSCAADQTTFKTPLTVWRGQTFQAENAKLSSGVSVIACNPGVCSNGSRVGDIGPHATVTFNDVLSTTAGSRVLIVYYADGAACIDDACLRYFNISVNGGVPQDLAFHVVKGGDWNVISSQPIMLTGFVAGATNTITFTGDATHPAPDLDWIEVE
jgi:hypothetical protein